MSDDDRAAIESEIHSIRSNPDHGFNHGDQRALDYVDGLYQKLYGGVAPGRPQAASTEDIDNEIVAVRQKTLSDKEMGRRLEALYKQKSNILAGRRVERLPESIDDQIEALRNDGKPNDERKQEKLVELYRQKALEKANEPPADPEAVSREVTTELRNSWGSNYEPKMNGIAEVVIDVFGGAERFKAFSETLALDRDEQLDAMHLLGDLAKPVSSEMPVAKANDIVTQDLLAMWGSDADERFELAQRAAKAAFGSLEKCEKFFIARGLAENPRSQVKAIVLLSRLGRKIKTETEVK